MNDQKKTLEDSEVTKVTVRKSKVKEKTEKPKNESAEMLNRID